jgi:arginine-tRNA-protein transferase
MPLAPPIDIPLTTLPPHSCAYLPGLQATSRAFRVEQFPGELYHKFMNAGFRRSGQVIYQPVCETCSQCVQIRVPVDRFAPNKSQRRCWRRNSDLRVAIGLPVATDEKFDLYQLYQKQWHAKSADSQDDDRDAFESFLHRSPVDTLEFSYRTPDGILIAVGIADVCRHSFSSVYFYFDPAFSERSLGTFGAVYEMRWAYDRKIPWYYLGYWVRDCSRMDYKRNFRPFQLLRSDGQWVEENTTGTAK